MFYDTYLEFHNRHEMYMLSLMNKIELLAVPHGLHFAEKQNCQYQIISNTAPLYALGFSTVSVFIFIGKFNDIWLSVMSIFPYVHVYTNG